MTTPTDGIAIPSTERPEPVTPRARRRGWSLRAHLIAVVLVTIVLVVLAGVLVTAKDYGRARDEAVLNARFEAKLAAGELSTSIPDLRALIVRSGASLGQATGGNLAAFPVDRCNLSFQSFRSFTSGVLHIVLPDGGVLCSSAQGLTQPGTKPYAGASWLSPVIQKGSATVVGPLRDPVSNKWALVVSAPIPNPNAPPDAAPPGALAVVLDLAPLAPALHDRFANDRYPGTSIEYLVTTAKRDRIVSRSTHPDQSVAKTLSAASFAKADSRKGALIKDPDGTERIYVGNTVNELNWHVYAGISKKAVYEPARAALRDHLTSGLIIVLGVALVALAGIFTVSRR
ncbi:MAG: sensor histidine kinase [Acidimicrobiales bacterium]|nr:sensor histidine kinase [Acidimicrobiales bacterium]